MSKQTEEYIPKNICETEGCKNSYYFSREIRPLCLTCFYEKCAKEIRENNIAARLPVSDDGSSLHS